MREDKNSIPTFSIVIAIHDDWMSLERCLHSLGRQQNAPNFEVIVVDDGSHQEAPPSVRNCGSYPLTIIRQSHAGIPTARNAGIRASSGSVILFTDADCRMDENCLQMLNEVITHSPHHGAFQLRLVGDTSNTIGRAEELRLNALHEHLLQSSGRIRYLNTAGFAIRRSAVNVEQGLFDQRALRAEDTMLLAELIQKQQLPLFVSEAIVEHAIPLTLWECVAKDVRSACLETETFSRIASMGVRIRMSERERVGISRSAWLASRGERSAWFVLICRKIVRRIVGSLYAFWLRSHFSIFGYGVNTIRWLRGFRTRLLNRFPPHGRSVKPVFHTGPGT
jgi:glycosyltransferase involved in cell wall biosynthesis